MPLKPGIPWPAESLVATLVSYLALSAPSLAQAVDSSLQHDLPIVAPEPVILDPFPYEPDFVAFDRDIVGRAEGGRSTPIENNAPKVLNLKPGTTQCYVFEKDQIFGRRRLELKRDEAAGNQRRDSQTIYLSANTCLQPQRSKPDATIEDPPQLTMLITESTDIGCPESSTDSSDVRSLPFDEGAASLQMHASGDVFITIAAPEVSEDYNGVYNFEVAASTDMYYHRYENLTNELTWMDSDSTSSLLLSNHLTSDPDKADEVMKEDLPYALFIDSQEYPALGGVRRSACGLSHNARRAANKEGRNVASYQVSTSMTTRGPGSLPKQQFYFKELNMSSTYYAILVKLNNETTKKDKRDDEAVKGGGGVVYGKLDFETLGGTNCKIVTDLDFCEEIQYSVPGNDERFNHTELARAYDNYARKMYSNFEKAMMQIPCEAASTERYSLARNCDDCMTAYKRWLCTVSIPRCEAIQSENAFAIERNAGQPYPNGTKLPDELRNTLEKYPYKNASRNSFIDKEIQPGPYKEILPCDGICYEVVQSCPAAIGFQCPLPGMLGFENSYGQRTDDPLSCNVPGEGRTPTSDAAWAAPSIWGAAVVAVTAMLSTML